MELHEARAVAHLLREQHVVGQRGLLAGGPPCKRGMKVADAAPLGEFAGVFAVCLAGEGQRAPAAHLPRSDDRRGVFVLRDEREVRLGFQVSEVITAKRGRLPIALPTERAEAAGDFERRGVLDERAARD